MVSSLTGIISNAFFWQLADNGLIGGPTGPLLSFWKLPGAALRSVRCSLARAAPMLAERVWRWVSATVWSPSL